MRWKQKVETRMDTIVAGTLGEVLPFARAHGRICADLRDVEVSTDHTEDHLVDGEVPHLVLSEDVVRDGDVGENFSMTVSLPTLEHEEPLTDIEQRVLADQVKAAVEQTLLRLYEMRRQKNRRDSVKVAFTARKGDGE